MNIVDKVIEKILDKIDNRKSVTEFTKDYDHVISNASLEDIKRGINRVYKSVNQDDKK